jgi:prevent-host-death family protein
MMAQVGVHEAKTHLSRLLRRVAAGEVIVIAKGGTPLARLVPIHSRVRRDLGRDSGAVVLHEDFDAPLAENQGQASRP